MKRLSAIGNLIVGECVACSIFTIVLGLGYGGGLGSAVMAASLHAFFVSLPSISCYVYRARQQPLLPVSHFVGRATLAGASLAGLFLTASSKVSWGRLLQSGRLGIFVLAGYSLMLAIHLLLLHWFAVPHKPTDEKQR